MTVRSAACQAAVGRRPGQRPNEESGTSRPLLRAAVFRERRGVQQRDPDSSRVRGLADRAPTAALATLRLFVKNSTFTRNDD